MVKNLNQSVDLGGHRDLQQEEKRPQTSPKLILRKSQGQCLVSYKLIYKLPYTKLH